MFRGATSRSYHFRLAHKLGYAAALWSALLAAMTGAAAQNPIGYEEAADIVEVVVTAERGAGGLEISRGWAVESEGTCYVIAPKHGVYDKTEGPFDNIVIRGVRENGVTQIQRPVTLARAFDADLALLRLSERECPFSLPSGFKPPPDDSRAWILRPFDVGYGRQAREVRSVFDFLTPDEYVARVPTNESAVPTGWSGSTVFLGNKRVGMVRAVDEDGRSVIFYTQKKIQDEVEDYLKVFGSEGSSWSDRVGETLRDCSDCPEMVVVPAGWFTMGSPNAEKERPNDEGPRHQVTISRPFAVGKYEVTFDQWDACLAGGGCNGHRPDDGGWGRGRRPVINVSWDDAKAYVRWLSGKTRQEYRLLSEAEWEYVARAGTSTPFSTGSTISSDQANYDGKPRYGSGPKGIYRQRTVPVGSFSSNAFGLYDVHGNVQEWTEDCWHDGYYGAPGNGGAWTTGGECDFRVQRGGSWAYPLTLLRSAGRFRFARVDRYDGHGFRVARTL